MQRNSLRWLLICVGLCSATGAGCPRMMDQYAVTTMRVLPEQPSMAQVIAAVNANTARVQSLLTTEATLSSPSFPNLRASMALVPPRRFRLRAETALSGPEVDLGSNEDLFWFWVRRNSPPAIYYCRHEQYSQGAAKNMLPIEPDWLIEALGITTLDPAAVHEGPELMPDGRLQVRTPRPTRDGVGTQVTILDANNAWILEQQLLDPRGQLVARAVASEHRRDPHSEVVMPHHVEIECPRAQFAMTLDIRELKVNEIADDQPQLWTRPVIADAPEYDLARGATLTAHP